MNVAAYLDRIAYTGPLDPILATLRSLHLAHLYTVPFENLDIHLGRPLSLAPPALFDKIVARRRGGFCYELNGLFAWLLSELGFRVTLLSAEVAGTHGFSPAFDHLALRVDLEEPWLVDVGFGDSFRDPLRIADSADQSQYGDDYLVLPDGDYRILMQRKPAAGDWTPQYRFTLTPYTLQDFEARCRYHQTSPDSHFTQNRICTLATPEGRLTVSGMRLIVTSAGGKTETELASAAEYAAVLRQRFRVIE
ncbi:MAG: arylamine N-acetyltransferase [Bryobacteraceae bacterium]